MAVYAYLFRNRIVMLCIGLIGSVPFPAWLWTKLRARMQAGAAGDRIVHILSTAYLIDGSFNQFLYFRF